MKKLISVLALMAIGASSFAQCDFDVSGIYYYCRPENPDSFFIAFRISGDADTLDIIDLNGQVAINSGIYVDDINNEEEPRVMGMTDPNVSHDPISLTPGEPTEYRYFGPIPDDSSFNVVIVPRNGACDTIALVSGAYSCNAAMSGACSSDVPFYDINFDNNALDSFYIIQRERIESCCDAGMSAHCFEFNVGLSDNLVGLVFEDIGSGATGGELLANVASSFSCTGNKSTTWPYVQENGASEPTLCLSGGETYVVASCKPGGNTTGVVVYGVAMPQIPDIETPETCNIALHVENATQVTWSSPDDPDLVNLSCTGVDSLVCYFSYNTDTFGHVTNCLGDTFYYIATATIDNNECIGEVSLTDTSRIIVLPVFTLNIDTICHDHPDSVTLEAIISGNASSCSYDYSWSNGDMVSVISVLADGSEYTVTINRNDIQLDEMCVPNMASATADNSTVITCNVSDEIFDCLDSIPEADLSLVQTSGCDDNLQVFSEESSQGSACAGDTLVVRRVYYLDFDGDLMSTGDRDSCVQLFKIVDTAAPVMDCPSDTVVDCTSSTDTMSLGSASAIDHCGIGPAISYRDSISMGMCAHEMTIHRIWTASDACGNETECIQMIMVQDTTSPVLICPSDTVIDCSSDQTPSTTGMAQAMGNCIMIEMDIVFLDSIDGGNCSDEFTIYRTWTATDSCGNSMSCIQVIQVMDEASPSLTAPNDTTIDCTVNDISPSSLGQASASDNCDVDVSITWIDDDSGLTECGGTGVLLRVFTSEDNCGNITRDTQRITLQDTTPPQLSGPANITVDCDQDLDQIAFAGIVTLPGCGVLDTTYRDDLSQIKCGGTGIVLRTWMIMDACGNYTRAMQAITLENLNCIHCKDTIITLPKDTCLDKETYEFDEVERFEYCGNSQRTLISQVSGACLNIQRSGLENTGLDTSCVVLCDSINGVEYCDTTIVIVVLQPYADTLYRLYKTQTPDTICFDTLNEWPMQGASFSILHPFDHFSPELIGYNGDSCLSYTNPSNEACIDTITVVQCVDTIGFDICDSTTVIVVTPPVNDTMYATLQNPDSIVYCFEPVLQFGSQYNQMTICHSASHVSQLFMGGANQDSCLMLMVNDHFVGLDTACVVHEYLTPVGPLYDTTTLFMIVVPTVDTIFRATDQLFCIEAPEYELAGTDRVEICGPGNEVTLNIVNDSCFILQSPMGGLMGADTVCIIMCDTIGQVEFCDTTYVITAPCPTTLACNDHVNLTLDTACYAEITGDMILEGLDDYISQMANIVVHDANGDLHPNAFDGSDVDEIFSVTVEFPGCVARCWGTVLIEDKHIPSLVCSDTLTVMDCLDDISPEAIGFPLPPGFMYQRGDRDNKFIVSGFDPCGEVWLEYYDQVTEGNCNTRYKRTIQRTWFVTDHKGNATSCSEQIAVDRDSLKDVSFPPSFDGFDKFVLECDDKDRIEKSQPIGGVNIGWNSLPNGFPSPHYLVIAPGDTLIGTGYPMGAGCDHLVVTYDDQKIQTCGPNTYKLLRTWKVYDWCTGEDTAYVQTIKVADTRAPVVICPSRTPEVISTDPWSCVASYIVPEPVFDPNFQGSSDGPVILRECNGYTYEVQHKIASTGTNSPDECAGVDNNATFFTNNVVRLPDGRWAIYDMPQGCNWIKYIIMDDCGNEVVCGKEVFVQDDVNPIPVCDEHTVVTLSGNGTAELCATSLDNGSQDNCTPFDQLRFTVRRMDSINAPFVDCLSWDCSDVANSPIMVIMRVTDGHGNSNDCMVEVNVQEKSDPVIICPDDITIDCVTDYLNDSLTGIPQASDFCGIDTLISEVIVEQLNDCGIGYVVKRWTAIDHSGSSASCDQRIDIVDFDPFNIRNIIWPRNFTANGCEAIDAHPDRLPLRAGWPRYTNEDCALPTAGYDDQIFYGAEGYCLKIIRTWTVLNWCQYDSTGTRGIWSREQIIYVDNRIAPTVTSGCEDLELCAYDDCLADVNIELSATDDCTLEEDLEWRFEIIDLSTGDIVYRGIGNQFVGQLSVGEYVADWFVKDGCSNETLCSFSIDVTDCKRPTPYCKNGIVTVVMPTTGGIETWARDFDLGSSDNCTDTSDLRFSFSSDTSDRVRVVNCGDLANGVVDTFIYEMWVTDEAGNQDYCTVQFIVQDNHDICPDNVNDNFNVSGLISTEQNDAIENVTVQLLKDGQMFEEATTVDDGQFAFIDLNKKSNWAVVPGRNDDHLNGVSTADLVMLQRHLLGIEEFTSPYLAIAADANNSRSVSAADISEIRKLILGIYSAFPKNQSWRFVDSEQQINDVQDPWVADLQEGILISDPTSDEISADFTGIKIGDLNGDAYTGLTGGNKTRSDRTINLEILDVDLTKGATSTIGVAIADEVDLSGLQFTLELGDLEFIDISSGALRIDQGNWHYHQAERSLVMSWSEAEGESLQEGDILFYLTLTAMSSGELNDQINLTSTLTSSIAYDIDLASIEVELEILNGRAEEVAQSRLYQNVPNPFGDNTSIRFDLDRNQEVELVLYDMMGKTQFTTKLKGVKGRNEYVLTADKLEMHGAYFYQLNALGYSEVKRLLFVNQ